MVGFGNAGSSSSSTVDKDPVSVNSRTGFRSLSTIPDLLGIDDYDFDGKSIYKFLSIRRNDINNLIPIKSDVEKKL